VYFVTFSGRVFGLDRESGKRCWDIAHLAGGVVSPPLLADGKVYFVNNDGAVAVDAHSGEIEWETGTISNFSSMAFSNGTIYVGTEDGSLTALGARSGQVKWTLEVGDFSGTAPAVVGGIVYAASDDGFLYAVDAMTGHQRWRYEVGKVYSRPTVVNGIVYVVADDRLIAITSS